MFTITDQVDRGDWSKFADRIPDANVFQLPEFSDVIGRARSHAPVMLAVKSDSRILALMLAADVCPLFGRFSGRSVLYGGVLFDHSDPEWIHGVRMLMQATAARCGGLFTEVRNMSDASFLAPVLTELGFQWKDHLNYLVDLEGGSDEVWHRFRKNERKTLRNGLNRGVRIEEVVDSAGVDECYRLFRLTYRRSGVPIPHASLFHSAFDVLRHKGMVKFLLARYENNPVAASAELIYKDRIYGWYQGSDRTFGSLPANDLLVWHILKWGAENGYRIYDFGGAGHPDREYGVRDFKAKFGGVLVNFGRFIYPHHPGVYRVADRAYYGAQKLLRSGPARFLSYCIESLRDHHRPLKPGVVGPKNGHPTGDKCQPDNEGAARVRAE